MVLLDRGNDAAPSAVWLPVKQATGISVADLNGDSIPDVVVSDRAGPACLLGNGDGTFQSQVWISRGDSPVLPVDLNHDGRVDVVSGGTHSGLASFLNTSRR